MTRRQQLILTLAASVVAGTVAVLAPEDQDELVTACARKPAACEAARQLGADVPVASCKLRAEPGFICRNGIKYGPGLGGSDADGNLVTCSCGGSDIIHPHTIMAGEDPDTVAKESRWALDPSKVVLGPDETRTRAEIADEIKSRAQERIRKTLADIEQEDAAAEAEALLE